MPMATVITSDIIGAGSHRLITRAVSASPGVAGVRKPAHHLIKEVEEIRPSTKATGAEAESDVVHTHRAAKADDMLASVEQASAHGRKTTRKPGTLPDTGLEESSRINRSRIKRGPYQAEPPRKKRIDILA